MDGWMDRWTINNVVFCSIEKNFFSLWIGYIHEIDIMHIKTISYLTLFLKSFWHLPFLFFHFLSCLFYYLSSSITETMPWLLPFYPPSDSDSPFLSLPLPSSPFLALTLTFPFPFPLHPPSILSCLAFLSPSLCPGLPLTLPYSLPFPLISQSNRWKRTRGDNNHCHKYCLYRPPSSWPLEIQHNIS